MTHSTMRAASACILFVGIGVFGWLGVGAGSLESLPLFLYYVTLILNTFFSIQTFSPITPKNSAQKNFDAALICIYGVLALSFGSVLLFSVVSASLFLVAIAKYIHLNRLVSHAALLHRKIKINALGVLLSLCAGMLAGFGYPATAAWILCVAFVLANIYVLAINPMYHLEHPAKSSGEKT